MTRSIIVAASTNGVIGVNNQIPWKLSADLKRFKKLTMGHHVIMGRRTYESIGRPLPGRTTVVLSRRAMTYPDGVLTASSLKAALELAAGDGEPFVCGGGEVYREALGVCDRVYLTVVERHFAGDTYFSFVNREDWRLAEVLKYLDEDLPHRFEIWERR